jgi:hypothetical protein
VADDDIETELSHITELCGEIDSLVLDDDWDGVVGARDSARRAVERGHQLWPVAAYAEYRMALDGPPKLAVSVVDAPSMRYAIGPFPEVIATTHRWDDVAPFVPGTPGGSTLAHEFVAAGCLLINDPVALSLPAVFDLPLELQAWEPAPHPAVYGIGRVEHPRPPLPLLTRVDVRSTRRSSFGDEITTGSLTQLVRPWAAESNGRIDVCAVDGDSFAAIATLGVSMPVVAEIDLTTAVALMTWVAAGGGAHGRRRGLASARSDSWWALTCLCGFGEDVIENGRTIDPTELAEALPDLKWTLWSAGEPDTGWAFQLAVEMPAESLAWAISAVDAV